MDFTDAEFMTAQEKQMTYKQWNTFLREGLKQEHFTKRIYNHLHLHCGFIAHYNIDGFYSTYFEAGEDTERFFDNLISDGGYGDTRDLTQAMIELYEASYKTKINEASTDNVDNRIALLEECVKRAKTDPEFAKQFLATL